MGWGFRKSIKTGGVKFNLSKSGVGVSAGVKGARIGVNSSGKAYVSGGSNGVYYRKNLGSEETKSGHADNQHTAWKFVNIVFLCLAVVLFVAGISFKSTFICILAVCLGVYMGYRLFSGRKPAEEFSEESSASVSDEPLPSAKISEQTWFCKKCQTENPATASSCKGCGEYR